MISVMLGLLAGVASQSTTALPPPPFVILTPAPRSPPPSPPLPPPAPDDGDFPSRAKASMPELFSTDDYPPAALAREETGVVSYAVEIDRDGRVTNCTVTNTSGSASLDFRTCSIIQSRARFRPARDAAGRRIEDRQSGRIRWQLPPKMPTPFADERMALVYTTNAAGEIGKCRIEGNAKRPADDKPCVETMKFASMIAAKAREHVALANRDLYLEQGVLIGGPDAAIGIGRQPGESLGMLVALALDIDAAGTVVRCVAADGDMRAERIDANCKKSSGTRFVPLDAVARDQSKRHAVRYWATYTKPIG